MNTKKFSHKKKLHYLCSMNTTNNKNIGQLIKEEVERKGLSAKEFAEKISCERTHVYKIYKKAFLDTATLGRISKVLDHNFFMDIAENLKLSGLEDENALQEIRNKMAVSQFVEVVPNVLEKLGVEPTIFLGRPLDIPKTTPIPEYYITPYENCTLFIAFSVGDFLVNKDGCVLSKAAKIDRFTNAEIGLEYHIWKFKDFNSSFINLKLDYKAEEEWENTLKCIFNRYFNNTVKSL